MIHAGITAAICAAFFICGLPWAACIWPAAFYLGREHAQAEYRYIEKHGGKRDDCPWYCGWLPESWTAKGLMDCLLPLAVSMAVAALDIFGKSVSFLR